jgi:hypothetical protein
MRVFSLRGPRRGLAVLLPVIAAACTDAMPTAPAPEPVPAVGIPALDCVVDVPGESLECAAPDAVVRNQAIAANRLLGGQDVYVRLTNTSSSRNTGAGTFEIGVTLQNLLSKPLGTSDGTTVSGVRVFFEEQPMVITGTGEVTLTNALTAFITAANQSYFLYNEILDPYEISAAQTWRFSMPATVSRFRFTVYISAPQADESQPLLDRVWDGGTSTAWADGTNWEAGVAPDSGSTVVVPPDSLLPVTALMPVLSASAQITHLRVGAASTLGLGGNTLTAWGNVDALGTIGSGTLWMRGAGTLLRGTVPGLTVTGTVTTQGTTQANGPVKITGGASGGSLTLSNYDPLKIVNPSP